MNIDKNEVRNLHGVVACTCGSKNIVATCYGYNYPAHRVEEWVVSCAVCGSEIDDEPTCEAAIQRWNRIKG